WQPQRARPDSVVCGNRLLRAVVFRRTRSATARRTAAATERHASGWSVKPAKTVPSLEAARADGDSAALRCPVDRALCRRRRSPRLRGARQTPSVIGPRVLAQVDFGQCGALR